MTVRRFYVTMTWHDFPEGGSYGTVVEARDHNHAKKLCREEMAISLSDESKGEDTPEQKMKNYGEGWHVIDCFYLDEFIKHHNRP